MIQVRDLSVNYGETTIISGISFEVENGSFLMIVGPNGAGKSTVIKAISQSIPHSGTVLIDGADVSSLKSRELARKIGVLSQDHYVGYGFTVEEVIKLGGYSRRGKGFLKKDSASADDEPAEELFERAVALTGLEPYLKQSVLKLSGGELQRTFLAQLFAQDPETLILDEPTNHLDLIYQKQIMEMIDRWRIERGRTIIAVVHDLSLAKMFGTDVLLIDKGKAVLKGTASQILRSENLDPVYNMDVAGWIRSLADVW